MCFINAKYNLSSIHPELCRYNHVGFYGFTANRDSVFFNLPMDKQYATLKESCTQAKELIKHNENRVDSSYFGDFNPNTNFSGNLEMIDV